MKAFHAHTARTLVRLGIGLAALGGLSLAHAGYAQLQPPAGVSTGTGGQLMFKPAANQQWLQSTVRTNAALNVGGRAVQVPVAMRMASNAPRYMARAAFSHPALLAGAIAAPYLLDWAMQQGFFIGTSDTTGQREWQTNMRDSQCDLSQQKYSDTTAWCQAAGLGSTGSAFVVSVGPESCVVRVTCDGASHNDYVPRKPGPMRTRPVTLPEFEGGLSPVPMPHQVPSELPVPLPVDRPIINPSPGANPVPQPFDVPMGDPVPVPNTDPQQWTQPVARVTPSPTPSDPWRVDVREDDRVTTSPEGVPDPEPVPDAPAPAPEPQPDFCEKNPQSIACAKMDTPEGEIPRQERTITYAPMDLGLGNGQCPAPVSVSTRLGTHTLAFDPACNFLTTWIRPVVIAFALLAAFFIVAPGRSN